MTCGPTTATFRLLDDTVGWEQRDPTGLVGFDKETGVRLANSGDDPDGPTRAELLPWFPDPRLAPGCRPCQWFLIAGRVLTRRDTCAGGWRPVLGCDPRLLRAPSAVATRGHRLVVVDSGRVYVWRNEGDHLVGVIHLAGATLAAPVTGDEVLVVRDDDTLWRFGSDGTPRGQVPVEVVGDIIGLRTGPRRTVWLLTDDGERLRIYRDGGESSVAALAAALPPSDLAADDDDGFCLRENGPDGAVTTCHTWLGGPRPTPPPPAERYVRDGRFVTDLVDSGISRCRWHRVRVTADVPEGTAVTVAVVVSEDGRFADTDWQTAPPGVTDFLVDQPPGRFLTARVELAGNGVATPVLHRVRLDFPRGTSADLLPAAFRQDPAADDFTERFLSLFDATLAEIDDVVERYPALLDPAGVPDRALPWLAGLLGLTFESGWDADTRRELIAMAPELYRRRGTPWAVAKAVEIVFGVEPVLDELADDRRWAHVRATATPGGAPGLGSVRLFGRSASRFRIGGSALGAAPLRAFGDPDTDPLTEHAHRFRVLLPAGQADEEALRRVVTRQAPAHTRASVRTGGAGFVVGTRSAVGVDTAFVPLPAPVLGGTRLNHDGVLRPGPKGARHGVSVGVASAVGIHTQIS